MNKGELVAQMEKDAKISKRQANNALNSAIEAVVSSPQEGRQPNTDRLWHLLCAIAKSSTGTQSADGRPFDDSARKVAKFVAGAKLKKAVKRGR
jgi:nucleoid DNA-binding protein